MRWFFIVLILSSVAWAQDESVRAFHRGNDAFEKGDFAGAIAAYESALTNDQESAALRFNLGTAHLRTGRPGAALYHFRMAEILAPRDGDIQHNLKVARERAVVPQPKQRPTLLRLVMWPHEKLRPMEALWLGGGLFVLGLAMLLLRLVLGRPKGRIVAMIAIVVGLALGLSLLARAMAWGEVREGVLIVTTATAWSGPSEEIYGKHFELAEGSEVEVLEVRDDGWVKVAAGGDRKQGYLRLDVIGLLPAPGLSD